MGSKDVIRVFADHQLKPCARDEMDVAFVLTTNIGQSGVLERQHLRLTPPAVIFDAILADGVVIDESVLSI